MKKLISAVVLILIQLSTHTYCQLWKQYSDSAKVYNDQKNADKAIELYTKAKEELKKDSAETHTYANVCIDLANIYVDLNQFEKSENLFLEARKIWEKISGKESINYGINCKNLGYLYSLMGENEKAEHFYLEATEVLAKVTGKENTDYATASNGLANAYADLGKYEKAEPYYLESKMIIEKLFGKEHPKYAMRCENLAILYKEMAQYQKAEPLFLEAKQIREKIFGKEHPDYAKSCNTLANFYCTIGQYQKAEPLYLEAKQIAEKVHGKIDPDYAGSCTNLAILYSDIGQYKKAEPLYLEAKQIMAEVFGKKHFHYASSCNNLGILYWKKGQYEQAELLIVEAKEIWEEIVGKEHLRYATGCTSLAALYEAMGQYEKAKELCLEAKRIHEKVLGTKHPDYAQECSNLASIYWHMEQYENAEPLFLEAKKIRENVLGKMHPEYATSCDNLAALYYKTGKYEKAEPLFLEAKQIRDTALGKEHPDYAISCNNLAEFYYKIGEYAKAEPLYLEAIQIRENVLGRGHSEYMETCINLANLYISLKDQEKANKLYIEALKSQNTQIKKIFQFASEAEKQLYLKQTADVEDYFLSFNTSVYPHSNQGFNYEVSISSRNLILSSSQQLRQAINTTTDTSIKNKYNAWIDLREQLSFWYAKPVAERPEYVTNLQEQANTFEKELIRLSSTFKKEQEQDSLTWKDIQQHLKSNEAAIEFVKFNFYNGKRFTDSNYYVALLLTKDKTEPELIRLFEEKQLKNYKTVNLLYGTKEKINVPYHLIWEPLEKHLNGITKIYFAPAGLLYRISFPALPVNDHQLLSDKYQLVQLNTTASVSNQSENFIDTADKIYAYGGIQYDADSAALKQAVVAYQSSNENMSFLPDDSTRGSSWEYLPGSEKEVREIDSLGKQKNYTLVSSEGVAATEESIKALNGNASPDVLHIATHGFFFPDPKEKKNINSTLEPGYVFRKSDNPLFRSGLLLAGANNAWQGKQIEGVEDGILTAYEVSNLYLPNTKLVVLSACETGLGDIEGNEGVYGLQRAFKIAGVENLVMSLWKVPDREAAEFMEEFYKNIFDKQSINDAFYNAQTMMKNKFRNEPKKWAAWILVR